MNDNFAWWQNSFKLLPGKVSQIFIQPPSCFSHKTAQRHIIVWYIYFLIEYPYGKNIFSINGSHELGQIADGKHIFIEWSWRYEYLCGNSIHSKIHRLHGQLKRKLADFTHIFRVSTYYSRHFIIVSCLVFGRICMTYLHRFDARKILWHMGMQLKKYTAFYFMMLGSFM